MSSGHGIAVYHGDGATYSASTTFTEVPNIESATPPTEEYDDVEKTHSKSTGRAKEFAPGFYDPGSLEFTAYDDDDQSTRDTLEALRGEAQGWAVLYNEDATNNSGGVGFTGYIKSIGKTNDTQGNRMLNVTVKVTGQVTKLAQDVSL